MYKCRSKVTQIFNKFNENNYEEILLLLITKTKEHKETECYSFFKDVREKYKVFYLIHKYWKEKLNSEPIYFETKRNLFTFVRPECNRQTKLNYGFNIYFIYSKKDIKNRKLLSINDIRECFNNGKESDQS